ncbi:MAG: LysR family transcriptional regulator [Candidatus Lumbricidophila eiseniae]|uniref:LysR family transcriptional regulator n=1 Tax=Candidatus Lumbricidiphila eiseniae TaxID=1969409 RepID=A0A2A6FTD3_9MICO|nr:MAG: LysR family transcriptional regulator [Candidatus Lumbricidophila eiseniae]
MLEPELLRSYVFVAEALSFSSAGRQLGVSQPTISQRIRRLEKQTGRQLLDRDTHGVTLTESGEAMLSYARRILSAIDEAHAYFAEPHVRGRIRFGSADDLALTHLPGILREFRRNYPSVNLEVTIGQSGALLRQLNTGRLDLIYVRQDPDVSQGKVVRREQFVWGAHRTLHIKATEPLPLVTYQPSSHSRGVALRALEAAHRRWTITCTARDITGILAGVRAGLGASVFPLSMMPPDLVVVGEAAALPELGNVDFVLLENQASAREPLTALSTAITQSAVTMQGAGTT